MARKSRTKPRFIIGTLEDSVDLLDQSLIQAYLDTNYWVLCPPQASALIRIGESQNTFFDQLQRFGIHTYAIITAFNPQSSLSTYARNQINHQALQARLRTFAAPIWPTIHVGTGSDWPLEHGFLIGGIAPSKAVEIGKLFNQNAIVWWQKNDPAVLWWL